MTLDLSLHFGSLNHEFSFKLFFFVWTNWGPSKMMPCRLNHSMICLGLKPWSKGFGTNLKVLTNRNYWFRWTLLLGPCLKWALVASSFVKKVLDSMFHFTRIMFCSYLVISLSISTQHILSHSNMWCYLTFESKWHLN
jgi:hypothetical protein